eukprot:TRINITY_DN14989_c0_g1_i1.p1 TRINITY_DN14989_c0_g1~~TRINITY_DN14989_c0_g1_i1.p1  ORF type:complete len:705 (-),score=66.22 TRINITY_DN14989_c0_g1_i1:299-2413(-)
MAPKKNGHAKPKAKRGSQVSSAERSFNMEAAVRNFASIEKTLSLRGDHDVSEPSSPNVPVVRKRRSSSGAVLEGASQAQLDSLANPASPSLGSRAVPGGGFMDRPQLHSFEMDLASPTAAKRRSSATASQPQSRRPSAAADFAGAAAAASAAAAAANSTRGRTASQGPRVAAWSEATSPRPATSPNGNSVGKSGEHHTQEAFERTTTPVSQMRKESPRSSSSSLSSSPGTSRPRSASPVTSENVHSALAAQMRLLQDQSAFSIGDSRAPSRNSRRPSVTSNIPLAPGADITEAIVSQLKAARRDVSPSLSPGASRASSPGASRRVTPAGSRRPSVPSVGGASPMRRATSAGSRKPSAASLAGQHAVAQPSNPEAEGTLTLEAFLREMARQASPNSQPMTDEDSEGDAKKSSGRHKDPKKDRSGKRSTQSITALAQLRSALERCKVRFRYVFSRATLKRYCRHIFSVVFFLSGVVSLSLLPGIVEEESWEGFRHGNCHFVSFADNAWCGSTCRFRIGIRELNVVTNGSVDDSFSVSYDYILDNWKPEREYRFGWRWSFDGFRCCGTPNHENCCQFKDEQTLDYCDNWPSRNDMSGRACPANGWECYFKIRGEDIVTELKTPRPSFVPYMILIGVGLFVAAGIPWLPSCFRWFLRSADAVAFEATEIESAKQHDHASTRTSQKGTRNGRKMDKGNSIPHPFEVHGP